MSFRLGKAGAAKAIGFRTADLRSTAINFGGIISNCDSVAISIAVRGRTSNSFGFGKAGSVVAGPIAERASRPTPLLGIAISNVVAPRNGMALGIDTANTNLCVKACGSRALILACNRALLANGRIMFSTAGNSGIAVLLGGMVPKRRRTALANIGMSNRNFDKATGATGTSIRCAKSHGSGILALSLGIAVGSPGN